MSRASLHLFSDFHYFLLIPLTQLPSSTILSLSALVPQVIVLGFCLLFYFPAFFFFFISLPPNLSVFGGFVLFCFSVCLFLICPIYFPGVNLLKLR